MILRIWAKLRAVAGAPATIALSQAAQQVLTAAVAQGYTISEDTRQGSPAIVLERDGTGKVHLWSSEDVVEFGKSKNLIR
jgi:hypothetical protein